MRISLERSRIIQLIIGTGLGILTVYLAFRGASFNQILTALATANNWLIIFSIGLVLFNVALVSLRWYVILMLDFRSEDYLTLLGSVYLSQMFNIILPLRLGELVRVYFVGEKLRISKSRLVGTLVLEKMVDLVVYGGGMVLLVFLISVPEWVLKPGQALIWLSVLSLLGVSFLTFGGNPILIWFSRWLSRLPTSFGERLAEFIQLGISGFNSLRSLRRQALIWGLTLTIFGISISTNYLVLMALSLTAPIYSALFVLIVLQVGTAPISSPGKLGIFHYLVVLTLSIFGVEQDPALAYALLLYIVALLPKIVIGFFVMIRARVGFPDLDINRQAL